MDRAQDQSSRGEAFAGLVATRRGVVAAQAGGGGPADHARFPLTPAGLADLVAWLERRGVVKVALRQGAIAWPWQAERARRLRISGPLDLDYWLEYSGPDALARVDDEAAWQPVMLVLRERFTLFLVRGEPAGRDTAENLARTLAAGGFLEAYPKQALERLIDRLAEGEPGALRESLAFFSAESRGHWHNRARAKIARRLKHRVLSPEEAQAVAETIVARLVEGRFTEQFKDQLRLLRHLDAGRARHAAELASRSPVPHIRKYGDWLAERLG